MCEWASLAEIERVFRDLQRHENRQEFWWYVKKDRWFWGEVITQRRNEEGFSGSSSMGTKEIIFAQLKGGER